MDQRILLVFTFSLQKWSEPDRAEGEPVFPVVMLANQHRAISKTERKLTQALADRSSSMVSG